MKSYSPLFLLLGGAHAFATQQSSSLSYSTSLQMGGFLDGRVPKNDIMKQEDDAMWIDDGSDDNKAGGWNPFAVAKSFDKPKKTRICPQCTPINK